MKVNKGLENFTLLRQGTYCEIKLKLFRSSEHLLLWMILFWIISFDQCSGQNSNMKYKKFIFHLTERIPEGIWRWLPNDIPNLKKLTFIYLLIHKQISWSLAICKLLKYKNHNVDRVFAIKNYLANCFCQSNFLVLKNSYPNLSSFFLVIMKINTMLHIIFDLWSLILGKFYFCDV